MTYSFCVFRTGAWLEIFRESFKEIVREFLFLGNHPNAHYIEVWATPNVSHHCSGLTITKCANFSWKTPSGATEEGRITKAFLHAEAKFGNFHILLCAATNIPA